MGMEGVLQQALEQHLVSAAKQVEDQLDNEIHRLEKLDGDDLERFRERRVEQMRQQAARRRAWLDRGHGEYTELTSEKQFFAEMKGEERMVCHFYRENWPCKASQLIDNL
jgi:hypothetical protein